MKTPFIAAAMIYHMAVSAPLCFGQSQALSADVKRQTIDSLATLLPHRYAYRDVATKLSRLLQHNLRAGKYDAYESPEEFSVAVTRDLRSLHPDRHLALNYNPASPAPSTPPRTEPAPLSPEERARRASEFNRQMNFGFKNVQFLNGNVGYLKFEYFDSFLSYSSPVVDAAMGFLKNSDALIIDLRDNGGGSPEMVAYIAGFFLHDRTTVGTSYNRLTDSTTTEIIAAQPEHKQLDVPDLYILTSKSTVSAAEALAYHLKYLKGAKVIGETSAGAANPGRVTRINSLFTAFIPNRYAKHAVTGTNWEGTGVPVDIAAPAEHALRIARLQALRTLRRKTSDPPQQRRYDSYITYLEKANPETNLPEATLRQYAGQYEGGRTLTLRDGSLHYSRVGEAGGRLHYVGPDVFMISEGDVTISFKRDREQRVVGLEHVWSLDGTPRSARKEGQ